MQYQFYMHRAVSYYLKIHYARIQPKLTLQFNVADMQIFLFTEINDSDREKIS